MDEPSYFRAAALIAAMLAVVPLAGLLSSGSWRAALRFTKDWLRSLAILGAAGCALGLVLWLWSIISPPA